MGGLQSIDRPLKIQVGGKTIHMSKIGSLHQALQHLLLSVSIYHYSETAIANLLSFANLQMNITLYITQELTTQYMFRTRKTVYSYNFKEIINATCTI